MEMGEKENTMRIKLQQGELKTVANANSFHGHPDFEGYFATIELSPKRVKEIYEKIALKKDK